MGHEAIYYECQLVVEVNFLSSGLLVILGVALNSKSSSFDIFRVTPLYQPNADGDIASWYQFPKLFFELFQLITLSSWNWVHLLCNNVPVTTASNFVAKVFLLPRTKLYSVLLLFFITMMFCPFAIVKLNLFCYLMPHKLLYLADGIYHVVSRHPALRMKNASCSAGFAISILTCQAYIVRPSCSSTLSFNQGDLVLTPDMDFCETHPLPLIASFQLTPSSDQVIKHVPPASVQFHVCSVAEARQSVVNSVRTELGENPDVGRMPSEALDQLTKPIAAYYSLISPATSAVLSAYWPTRTGVCFSLLSITVSLLTFYISFTLFRRQWRRVFSNPQHFFRGTSGRFLHIVDNSSPTSAVDSSFLYLSVAEFNALLELAQ